MVKSVLRIILVGNTGAGKSASGNTILGRRAFKSENGADFVTKSCQEESSIVGGRKVSVLDTPDLFNMSGQELEIERVKDYIAEGPCAVLPVIKLDGFVEERLAIIKNQEELFGESLRKSLILFNSHQYDDNIVHWKMKYPALLKAMENFGNKYHIINNHTDFSDKNQVNELLMKIETALTPQINNQKAMEKKDMKILKEEDHHPTERRIVLLGKTGVGKSATGNTILGVEVFRSACDLNSVTRECQKGTAFVADRCVTVVDTPDFFYTTQTEAQDSVNSEIGKSISLCAPGPHAFLFVIPVGTFTEQETDVMKLFELGFGETATRYTLIVFTHGDELHNTKIEMLIEKNKNVWDLLQQWGGRYHVVNNKDKTNIIQVTELLEKVDKMVSNNRDSFYTLEMFQAAEQKYKDKWEMMLREMEEAQDQELERSEEKHQQELERLVRDTEIRVRRETEERIKKERKEGFIKEEMMKRKIKEEIKWEIEERIRTEMEDKFKGAHEQQAEEAKTGQWPEKSAFLQLIVEHFYILSFVAVVAMGSVTVWQKGTADIRIFVAGSLIGGLALGVGAASEQVGDVAIGFIGRAIKQPSITTEVQAHTTEPTEKSGRMAVTILSGTTVGATIGMLVGPGGIVPGSMAGVLGAIYIAHKKWNRKTDKGLY